MKSLVTAIMVFAVLGATPAWGQTGAHQGQVLLDGCAVRLLAGEGAGSYRTRGVAEYLLSGHVGLRASLDATVNDPTLMPGAKLVKRGELSLGVALHPLAATRIDPYLTAGLGGRIADNDWLGPKLIGHVGAGLNVHVEGAFLGVQVGWHLGSAAAPAGGEMRVQLSVGFSFDT